MLTRLQNGNENGINFVIKRKVKQKSCLLVYPSCRFHKGATRQDAQQMLLDAKVGSFLVRGSDSSEGKCSCKETVCVLITQLTETYLLFQDCYALVIKARVRVAENSAKKTTISYKIKKLADGQGYFIVEDTHFESIPKLIDFYQTHNKLKVPLTDPVERVKQEGRSRDKWEISRDSIHFTTKIGEGAFGTVSRSHKFV